MLTIMLLLFQDMAIFKPRIKLFLFVFFLNILRKIFFSYYNQCLNIILLHELMITFILSPRRIFRHYNSLDNSEKCIKTIMQEFDTKFFCHMKVLLMFVKENIIF